jgi:purine-binding chemotaxis protein CheW
MDNRVHAEAFDWAAARERLHNALRRLEARDEISALDSRRILDERARALARPAQSRESQADGFTAVLFEVGTESYAIDARYVREAARVAEILSLPGTPPFVIGAARVRGEIHAVFDIGVLLGGAPATVSSASRILILGRGRPEFGIVADTVKGIFTLNGRDILTSDKSSNGLVRGTTRDVTSIIDGEALMKEPKLYMGTQLERDGEDENGA